MRAITLTMTAFGPYNNEQTIDFRELGNESIFLITGPTGAGKTTIFDAICYALYGKASGSDRDQDSLRSHFAEVGKATEISYTFALKDKTYKVIRNPKQLKLKERGEGFTEEPARAVMYEIDGEGHKLVTSKIKDVNDLIEQKLGLDYEQFRKMIMIPQGEFRKLISENSKEREEILQKIFRTHFYERITEEFKRQSKELKESIRQLDWQLEQEFSKINWIHFQPEEIDSTEKILEKLQAEIKETEIALDKGLSDQTEKKKEFNKAQEKYYQAKQLLDLFNEKENLLNEKQRLKRQEQEILEKQNRVKLAETAARVVPFEEQMVYRKQEWQEQNEKLAGYQKKQQEVGSHFSEVRKTYEEELNKETDREKLKAQIDELKQQLESIMQYQLLLAEKQQVETEQQTIDTKIIDAQQSIKAIIEQSQELEQRLSNHEKWTKEFYHLENERKNVREIISKLKNLIEESHKLNEMRQQFQKVQRQFTQEQQKIEQLRDTLTNMEDEKQRNHARYLAQNLQPGTPCPVCGSTDHPQLVTGTTIDSVDKDLEKTRRELKVKEKNFTSLQNDYIQVKSDGQTQRRLFDQAFQEFEEVLGSYEEESVKAYLATWKEKETELSERLNKVSEYLKSVEKAKDDKQKLQEELDKQQQLLDKYKEMKEKISGKWYQVNTKIDSIKNETKNVETDPSLIRTDIAVKERQYQDWLKYWNKLQQTYQHEKEQLHEIKTITNQLQAFTVEIKAKYDNEAEKFEKKRLENGFKDEAGYHSAKVSEAKLQEWKEAIQQYNQKYQFVSNRLDELNVKVNGVEKPDLAMMEEKLSAWEKKLEEIHEANQSLSVQIQQLKQIDATLYELVEQHTSLSKQYFDIGELADLARGENHLRLSFERYVLSSFLDEILMQANIRLDQMTDHRYQLIRSDQVAKRGAQSGLDLEVVDHHTGQQRSVKTLSGGEGFKASLSLALGLSDVVQAHAGGVQLDTLFIDEGFGTLDELSLEQAIDCLKGLQQSNRLLGIISHVPQLKEEIQAKLQITPSQKGSHVSFLLH
ncbi:AAA family ATPase [Sediminibacillus massiliensis]|uniref:AAA family ATPase n=1 Tax=Sediminibacillus massiliensis TaxID=1926277 RepID=UPI0015C3BDA7|nr:AAA family ATPase [Sediminibacillus massiliensis]